VTVPTTIDVVGHGSASSSKATVTATSPGLPKVFAEAVVSAQASMQCYAGAPTSTVSSTTAERSPVSPGRSLPSRTTSRSLIAVTKASSRSRSCATTRGPNPTRGQRSRTVPATPTTGSAHRNCQGLPRKRADRRQRSAGVMVSVVAPHDRVHHSSGFEPLPCARLLGLSTSRPRGSSCLPTLKSMSERCLGSTRQPGCRHRSARHAFSRGAGSAGL
jgi:hypothetical protein